MCIIKAKLLTYREEYGGYIIYVFQNLDSESWDSKYVMTVRFPNWNSPLLKVGDTGFLEFKEVIAGESTWYDNATGKQVAYKYSNIIFEKFILDDKKKDLSIML